MTVTQRALCTALIIIVSAGIWAYTAPRQPEIKMYSAAFPAVKVKRATWLQMFPHVEAVTLPGRIYYRDSVPRPYLLAHEYAHVRQWEWYGVPAMSRQILREWPAILWSDSRRLPRIPGTLEYAAALEAGWLCWQAPDLVPAPVCDEVLLTPGKAPS